VNTNPRIKRAEDVYLDRRLMRAAVPLAELAFRKYPPVLDGPVDLARRGTVARGLKIEAEVNHGRWVARCPFCPSAQVVTPADPRFLCAGADGCANAPAEGAFVRVVFPAPAELAAIEALLAVRPAEARNWTRAESVDDLKKENKAHGMDNA
jgi:hypothetical protein